MGICRRQFNACLLGALAGRSWAAPSKPKLTVLVIIEQLRSDALDAGWPLFTAGGFRRLADRGAWFPDCRHLSSTFSATGIANLATGAWPAQHGIIADAWYDSASKSRVSASEEMLLATTLAAQSAAAADPGDGGARVTVVAMARAHAALFAGTPNANLYFLDEHGQFAASGTPPGWLAEYNLAKSPERARDTTWMALNVSPDAPPLRKFPYEAKRPEEFLGLYKASPLGQTAEFDMAAELVVREKLGQGSNSDFLCLIDGSAGLLGYETGARSPLMKQMVLQLDRRIEKLWDTLAKAVGESGFNLVVCAAHGAPPEPAPESRVRMAVDGETIAQAVENVLKESNRHVEKYLYPFLYIERGSTAGGAEVVRKMAAEAALAHPAVAAYYTAGGACSLNSDWEKRFQNSFHAQRSGDVMLSYRPEYVEDFHAGRGISYGSLYSYDSRVPLFLYGPQFKPGLFDISIDAVDIAPTLARAMGIAEPSSTVGRVLHEALVS